MTVSIDEIKEANRIEELATEAGYSLRGTGRFRKDAQHDSFVFDLQHQSFHWNSRGVQGDIVDFVQFWKRTDFKGAMEFLARRAGMPEPVWGGTTDGAARLAARAREDALTVACRRWVYRLHRYKIAMDYARSRGWTIETMKAAGLGFTGQNTEGELTEMRDELRTSGVDLESPGAVAIVGFKGDVAAWMMKHQVGQLPAEWLEKNEIPPAPARMLVYAHVVGGRVRYVSWRSIEDKRHLNPREAMVGKRQPYFNHEWAPGVERCVVVEGQADAVTLGQWGLPAVALAGVTADAALLKRLGEHTQLYIALDQDKGGEAGGLPLAKAIGPLVRMVRWPEKDANDTLKAMVTGSVAPESQLAKVRTLLEHSPTLIEEMAGQASLVSGADRDAKLRELFGLMTKLGAIDQAMYRDKLAKLAGVPVREFNHILKSTAKDQRTNGAGGGDDEATETIVGGWIKGWLIDLLYDPDEDRTLFAYRAPDGTIGTAVRLEIEGKRYVPKAPDSLIRNDAVVLPSAIGPEVTEAELVAKLVNFVHRHYLIDGFFEKMAAYYIMLTWHYDSFRDLPYLRALGDFGAGKTQLMMRIGHACYRLIKMSGAASEASMFRTMDLYRGTLFVDEADLQLSDESVTLIKILNTGNQKGLSVFRMKELGGGKYEPEAFVIFSPKLLATRQRFDDEALESRCLTIEVIPRSTAELRKAGVPLQIGKPFYDEARELRNMLLTWRLRTWQPDVEIDDSQIDEQVQARLNQVAAPLKQIVKDPALKAEIVDFVRHYHDRMVTEKSLTLEAKVLQALVEIQEAAPLTLDPTGRPCDPYFDFSVKNIAKVTNQIIDQENLGDDAEDRSGGKKLTPRGVGSILRKGLQLQVERATAGPLKGNFVLHWDDERILGLRGRYGL
jgi:hypothetical protein